MASIMIRTLVFCATMSVVASQGLREDLQFTWNSVKLPYPVSDITATYMPGENGDEDGFIIITGGCDSVNGNERVEYNGEDLFACLSSTNKTLKFDPFANTFQQLADAPHERQRHAAAVVNNDELFVVGGRDSNDDLVPYVDAFNPQTNTWRTVGQLPNDIVTSDLAAWSWKNYLYVADGYIADYTAVGTTFRVDVTALDAIDDNNGMLTTEPLATSDHPRGDLHAVVLYGYAYLAGGITHTSLWCEGLRTTERYHMESDQWEVLSDMHDGRADMAVAALNGKLVAIGGETKPDDCKDIADPAYGSFPASHVDVLPHGGGSNTKWMRYEPFVDKRFRFAAAVVPAQDRIYTFGGQLPHDFTCDCFPTTDDVGVGTEVLEENHDLSPGAIVGIVIVVVVALLAGYLCFRKYCSSSQQEVPATSTRKTHQDDADFDADNNGMAT